MCFNYDYKESNKKQDEVKNLNEKRLKSKKAVPVEAVIEEMLEKELSKQT